jgi:hypothetical protein
MVGHCLNRCRAKKRGDAAKSGQGLDRYDS